MKIGFVGGSYTSRSTAVSDEECINFFYETTETISPKMQKYYDGTPMMATYTQPAGLFWTPGLKVFANLSAQQIRAIFWTGARLFVVADDQFIELSSTGAQTVWGTVENDQLPASIAASNIQLLIVSGGHAYCFVLAPAPWAADTTYAVGAQILDPTGNFQSATSAAWAANTAYALGAQIVDSNGNVQQAYVYEWAASATLPLGFEIVDSNGNIQRVTTAGTSGTATPTWRTAGTTADGTIVWTYIGAAQNAGTSGSIAPTWSTSGDTSDGTTPLFWVYQGAWNGEAGTSGATIPAFNDGSGSSTPDGTGTLVWVLKGARLLEVTSQLSSAPVQVQYADGYFIVNFKANNQFQISNILDGTTWQGIFVNAISVFPENIVSIIVSNRELWVFGAQHTQPYSDTGSSSLYDPIPGSLMETGCAASFAPCRLDNSVFWIGQDERGARIAYRSNGYIPQRVSTYAVETDLATYADISGLVAYAYQEEGHAFWMLYIPGSKWTWAYDVAEGIWHKRAAWNAGTGTYGPHQSWNHAYAWGKNLVGDWNSGNIYEMSLKYWDDNGANIRRLRRSPTVGNEMAWQYHTEMTIDFDTGLGQQPPLLDGNNAPRQPQAMLRWSDDRGKTWSNEHVVGCGTAGEYDKRAVWRRLGRSRYRVYELTVTDPIPWAITGAYLTTTDQKVPT